METLEELAVENRELFLGQGGETYAYIPALNANLDHIEMLSSFIQAQLDVLKITLAH